MITLEDCLAFCGLSHAEVEAIAEHEHIPEACAEGLARYLLGRPGGLGRIREMILDDIASAHRAGRREHARDLAGVLQHFLEAHPEAGAASLAGGCDVARPPPS